MSKYRRIEVNAYRRRVTIVSGESRTRDAFEAQPMEPDERISLADSDSSEPVASDSPEGQMILVDAVRSLERRLSPEARAAICANRNGTTSNELNRNHSYLRLRSIYDFIPGILRFTRKEKRKDAAKQSVTTDSAQ